MLHPLIGLLLLFDFYFSIFLPKVRYNLQVFLKIRGIVLDLLVFEDVFVDGECL